VRLRSTAFYEKFGVKYLYGEEMKSGDVFIIPPGCPFSLENWSGDEEALLGYASVFKSSSSSNDDNNNEGDNN